ncbi:MAG: hypothetical protein WCK63_17015 [Betaproteobacteria bacterium]
MALDFGDGITEGAAFETLASSTETDARDTAGAGNIQMGMNVLGGKGSLQIRQGFAGREYSPEYCFDGLTEVAIHADRQGSAGR